ncbi:MAG TPA: ribokinase, partial [Micrococcales bacterium]|nr:ribokinase [Micrococcales bacterium]
MVSDVVVVGSANVDLLLEVPRHPAPGETLLGGGGASVPGGKGANQAVAAALSGARTAFVGAVGDDAGADVALRGLRRAGVDIDAVAHVPGPTGLAVVTVADSGENTIVVVPGANAAVDVTAVEGASDRIRTASVCVLQLEVALEAVERAARLAHDGGCRVVLNAAPAASVPLATLRLADPLVVNEHEAAIVLAGALEDVGSVPEGAAGRIEPAAPGESLDAAPDLVAQATGTARALRGLGVRSVVVTLGGRGSVGVEPDGAWHVPARIVEAVDTTGAGDAFVGALAAGLASGSDLRAAAEHATRFAAASVRSRGAQDSYPDP